MPWWSWATLRGSGVDAAMAREICAARLVAPVVAVLAARRMPVPSRSRRRDGLTSSRGGPLPGSA
ncbi:MULTISPECIES: hypothetical protein [unclassified Frankia]|nr:MULTISPECIES: hypothetical protein [unclassified Frankia]